MAVSLIKKDFLPLPTARPIPVMMDTLPNHVEVECPHCAQQFILGHGGGEEFRLTGWIEMAERAIGKDHWNGHRLMALALPGIPR